MAVEDVDDDAGAVDDLGLGGALEIAGLTRGDLVVDDDHVGMRHGAENGGAHRVGKVRGVGLVGLAVGFEVELGLLVLVAFGGGACRGSFESVALVVGLGAVGLGLGGRARDDAGAPGVGGQLHELAAAEDGTLLRAAPFLGDDAHDLVAERFEQTLQLSDVALMFDVGDIVELERADDGGRDGFFGLVH